MAFTVIPMQPRTLSWWRDERDDVEFDPVYQRKGHIWSDKQKQYLIDSILNGFDIPKVYVADFTILNSQLNQTKKHYAVIDGKQRMLAIIDFYEGRFTLANDFVYQDDPSLALAGLSYQDLVKNHPRIARKFDNYSLTVMSVITDDEGKINDLFVRLNTSKPLTGAELRNAMTGTVPDLIRDLAAHTFFQAKIRFGTGRSQDRNTAAKLLLIEHRGALVDTKKAHLDQLAREFRVTPTTTTAVDNDDDIDAEDDAFEESDAEEAITEAVEKTENPDISRSAERVRAVLNRLNTIFIDRDPLLVQQAQVPVIYWLVRGLDEKVLAKVRPFLVQFEELRRSNKTQAAAGKPDAELAQYELMARTSNDASSIKLRYQTLSRRFDDFVQAK
jgi:hypothetical protein